MAKVKITGHASGSGVITVTAPNTSTDRTITLPDATATIATTTDVAARLPSITDNGNATAITISAEEHVGIGVVPESDWSGGYSVLQMGTTGAFTNDTNSTVMGENWKHASGNKYLTTGEATRYYQNAGNHYFQTAASGSADAAISFTDVMTINNTGAVTMPAQPAFLANLGTAVDLTSTEVQLKFTSEYFDVGNNHNGTTGRFTAPVAGVYMVTWGGTTYMAGDEAYATSFVKKNGSNYEGARNRSHNYSGNRYSGQTITLPIYLSASDYVTIHAYSQSTNSTVSDNEYSFGVYLLG